MPDRTTRQGHQGHRGHRAARRRPEPAAAPSRSAVRSGLSFVGRVVSWSLLVLAIALLALTIVLPRVAGASSYTILTGSMEPGMPPGTLAVVRPTPIEDIGIGTVVTYQLSSGEGSVVTHRVVGVAANGRGETELTTRGDANNVDDAKPVRPVQVRGALWYAVPYLGYVNTLLTGQQHIVLTVGLVGLLVAYAVGQFAGALRDRRRRRAETTAASTSFEGQNDADVVRSDDLATHEGGRR